VLRHHLADDAEHCPAFFGVLQDSRKILTTDENRLWSAAPLDDVTGVVSRRIIENLPEVILRLSGAYASGDRAFIHFS